MANIAAVVDQALREAGIPILGVSIANRADRATWRVDFDPAATAAQRSAAATLLTTVAIDAAAQTAQDQKEAQAQIDAIPIVLKAIVLTLVDQINVLRAALPTPLPAVTPQQAISAIRNKVSTL
jgi:hypothetical protein